MSKESKPRDRWSQVFTTSHDRPDAWCKGCGYYPVVHGDHRADCTSPPQVSEREALENIAAVFGQTMKGDNDD
jgi:hypothetical protein